MQSNTGKNTESILIRKEQLKVYAALHVSTKVSKAHWHQSAGHKYIPANRPNYKYRICK